MKSSGTPLPLRWTIYGLPPFLQENLNPSMIFQKSQPINKGGSQYTVPIMEMRKCM